MYWAIKELSPLPGYNAQWAFYLKFLTAVLGYCFCFGWFVCVVAGGFRPLRRATRAVCPGPDKGLFRKDPLTPNLFSCVPIGFFKEMIAKLNEIG